jgi:RNA polymerase sigma factor (sigma-70 family)
MERNDAAFAELVAHYSPMVYRACLRVLGNASDAEDATQAAFLVLARKAGSLRQEGRLNGWLHRVARQVALQALRVRADRERRQEHVAVSQESMTVDTPEVDREVVFQAVDAELDGLSAILREAIILRYLRGFSEQAAASAAGCPLGTMKRRASDGIAKLRQRLAKRGVALGGVALVGLLTSEASAAVPETLLPSILATVKTAAATTATATGATTTAGMLAKGAMKAMFIAKVKMVAAVVAVSVGVLGGGGVAAVHAVAQQVAPQGKAMAEKISALDVQAPSSTGEVRSKEYYGTINFAKMDNAEIFRLMKIMVASLKDIPMAKSAYGNIKQEQWTDKDRDGFIEWAKRVDEEMTGNACNNMRDPDYGRFALLRFYHGSGIAVDRIKKGLNVSEEVIKMPLYADSAQWLRAELFEMDGKFAEAIECYKISSNEPEKYFRIAENLLRLKQKDQALAELRGVEKFFEESAPRAALRIAYIYQGAQEKANFIGALRDIMKKYPSYPESNTAHIELERME